MSQESGGTKKSLNTTSSIPDARLQVSSPAVVTVLSASYPIPLRRDLDLEKEKSFMKNRVGKNYSKQEIKTSAVATHAELNVPADPSCLFWSVALGVLIPVLNDETAYREAFNQLFATQGDAQDVNLFDTYSADLKGRIQTFTATNDTSLIEKQSNDDPLYRLINRYFRQKVASYIASNPQTYNDALLERTNEAYVTALRSPDFWGGQIEIHAIFHLLGENYQLEVAGAAGSNFLAAGKPVINLVFTNAEKSLFDPKNHYNVRIPLPAPVAVPTKDSKPDGPLKSSQNQEKEQASGRTKNTKRVKKGVRSRAAARIKKDNSEEGSSATSKDKEAKSTDAEGEHALLTAAKIPAQTQKQSASTLETKKEAMSIGQAPSLSASSSVFSAQDTDVPRFFLGNDNFQSVAEQNKIIVDKTAFIAKVLQLNLKALLYTRPPRFGKTFNLSMLACFLDCGISAEAASKFFGETEIYTKYEKIYDEHRGQYSVIFLTLKNITSGSFEDALAEFWYAFTVLYKELKEKYNIEVPYDYAKEINPENLYNFLSGLIAYVEKNSGKRVFLLIDEYDAPLYRTYLQSEFEGQLEAKESDYSKMVSFTRELLDTALKSKSLAKAILTGIVHDSNKELPASSGVCTVLDEDFDSCFGFTKKEIQQQLQNAFGSENARKMLPIIMDRYAGYHIGTCNLAPPWTIAQFIEDNRKKKDDLKKSEFRYPDYWLNSSNNKLIRGLYKKQKDKTQSDWSILVSRKTITKKITRNFSLKTINSDEGTLWSFLLHYGYLTVYRDFVAKPEEKSSSVELMIPNQEVLNFFRSLIGTFQIKEVNISGDEFLNVSRYDIENGTVILPYIDGRDVATHGTKIKSIAIGRHGTFISTAEDGVTIRVGDLSVQSSGSIRVTTPSASSANKESFEKESPSNSSNLSASSTVPITTITSTVDNIVENSANNSALRSSFFSPGGSVLFPPPRPNALPSSSASLADKLRSEFPNPGAALDKSSKSKEKDPPAADNSWWCVIS